MASCYSCVKYDPNYGPHNSSYCTVYSAKLNESEKFLKFYNMGNKSTQNCPEGKERKY